MRKGMKLGEVDEEKVVGGWEEMKGRNKGLGNVENKGWIGGVE